jgi:hypothetical protein
MVSQKNRYLPNFVIPAKAGIQQIQMALDSCFPAYRRQAQK